MVEECGDGRGHVVEEDGDGGGVFVASGKKVHPLEGGEVVDVLFSLVEKEVGAELVSGECSQCSAPFDCWESSDGGGGEGEGGGRTVDGKGSQHLEGFCWALFVVDLCAVCVGAVKSTT